MSAARISKEYCTCYNEILLSPNNIDITCNLWASFQTQVRMEMIPWRSPRPEKNKHLYIKALAIGFARHIVCTKQQKAHTNHITMLSRDKTRILEHVSWKTCSQTFVWYEKQTRKVISEKTRHFLSFSVFFSPLK